MAEAAGVGAGSRGGVGWVGRPEFGIASGWVQHALPPPLLRCGMSMLNPGSYPARHGAAKQQRQNKKVFRDIVMGVFRFDRWSTLWKRLEGSFKCLMRTYKMSDTTAWYSFRPLHPLLPSSRCPQVWAILQAMLRTGLTDMVDGPVPRRTPPLCQPLFLPNKDKYNNVSESC